MAEWARLAATTITDYAKGYEDELVAKRVLLAAIKKEGNIKYNCGGAGTDGGFSWRVPYKQVPLLTDDGETPITPTRKDRFKSPNLSYVFYRADDMMTWREKTLNKGPGQIINYYEEMAPMLMEDITQRFSEELYIDSSASGNSQRLSGIETMMAAPNTVNLSSGADRGSASSTDVVGYPNDTYAGLSTVLGNYAGSWDTQSTISTTWPAGRGDLAYDFWSPVIVNYDSDSLEGSTHTWDGQAVYATRYLITHMNKYVSERGSLKVGLFDRDLFRRYLNQLDSKERILVKSELGLRALGFEDAFSQDGVDMTWEFGIPSAVAYFGNIKHVKMRSCQDRLFMTEGPWYEKLQQAYIVNVKFAGQLQFSAPRFFGKLALLAT